MKIPKVLLIFACSIFIVNLSYAEDSFKEAVKESDLYVDLRLRYEFVDQDGLSENAHAKTARTRLGFKTGEWRHVKGVIEGENVVYLGNDTYNDTVNGRTSRPVVADPENTQVNQAYLEFSGIPDTTLKGGRQVIALDGHRFIGDVGWRQNNQVFDAAYIENTTLTDTVLSYGYIYNVNRIFGEQSTVGDWKSDSHIVNVSYKGCSLGTWTAYSYLLDFKSDSPANSSQTYGGSFFGKTEIKEGVSFKYYGEYANQSEFGDNTVKYNANYFHIAPALVWENITTTVGYEVLGSDNGSFAFRTPLATLHKWNGWADKFLTTPNAGLEDFYIDISYKISDLEGYANVLNNLALKFQYHDFTSEEGGVDYGTEWGISLSKNINDNVYLEAKYADYNADEFATDTQKTILGIGFKY